MRIISFLFLLLAFTSLSAAEDFSVFKKNGRFGVKNESGTVIVPAVYDQLGWSDGSSQIFDDVIGYKRNGLWGLVSVKNKILAENKFYTITPISPTYIKASVKGKFSNQLFYGLLDTAGKILISFNYSGLEMKGSHLVAMSFEQLESKVGIINLDNEVVIPLEYRSISEQGEFVLAERSNQQKDVFFNLKLVAENLDSVQIKEGLIGFRGGKAGFLNSNGQLIHDFDFKNISVEGKKVTPVTFPKWEVHDPSGEIFETSCDSLSLLNEKWVIHLNGAQHFKFPKLDLDVNEHLLESISGDKLVMRHSRTNEWSVWDESGRAIIEGQDHIKASGEFFLTLKNERWHIFNSFGSKISNLPFQEVEQAGSNFFIAKRDGYWGVIDFKGDTYITFKYDSIISASTDYYAVKFLGKWGITDRHGNWKVNPEYQQIEIFGNIMVGKKGLSYSYFNDGEFLFRSTFVVKSFLDDYFLIENETGKKGLMSLEGRLVEYPSFDAVRKEGDYFVFQVGDSSAVFTTSGETVIDFEEGYQDFGKLEKSHIPAKRNERWGFVDIEGRLRIANRYEEVRLFEDGYAAIKLRGRWGFIDENEHLVIQPHYQSVSSFYENVAIVESRGSFGLINKKGEEVVSTKWASVTRTKYGNYVVSAADGSTGLVDAEGSFILRPNYDYVEDIDLGIIVQKDGKFGILNYDGSQIYNLIYSSIRKEKEFLMLAK